LNARLARRILGPVRSTTLVIALLVAGALVLLGPAPAAAACQQFTGAEPVSPGTSDDNLFGVVVLGACNAWAVGQSEGPGQSTLVEHWNGRTWRQVPSPNPGTGNILNRVSSSWAVGSYNASGQKTLILRRVGNSWAQLTSPNPGSTNDLQDVAQISSGNAWAAGYIFNGTSYRTMILHWNGTSWKRVQSPNAGDASTDNMLFGIAARGAGDIWAVGQRETAGGPQPLTLHWNGSKWKVVAAPTQGDPPFGSSLVGVAIDSQQAWAAGVYTVGSAYKPLVLRWNGEKWKRAQLPSFPTGTVIEAVEAISPRNAWAVGEENGKNLVLHWNGRSWKKVQVQNPGTLENIFHDVEALSASEMWMVGSSRDSSTPVYETRAMHCC
jgi:hypothetical protein